MLLFKIKKDNSMYESLVIGMILAFAGGFLDVYTYVLKGGVFAFAQTGNMLLMAIKFANKEWKLALYYLIPIIAFTLGIFLTEYLKMHLDNMKFINCQNIVLVIEIAMLIVIGFLPETVPDNFVCVFISFICSMQTNCFRKLSGAAYSTTMCTGNLRTGTEYLFKYIAHKDKEALYKATQFFIIIFTFIVGALIGTICTLTLKLYSIWICAVILTGVLMLILYKQKKIHKINKEKKKDFEKPIK